VKHTNWKKHLRAVSTSNRPHHGHTNKKVLILRFNLLTRPFVKQLLSQENDNDRPFPTVQIPLMFRHTIPTTTEGTKMGSTTMMTTIVLTRVRLMGKSVCDEDQRDLKFGL
jgi:hypothetical protein